MTMVTVKAVRAHTNEYGEKVEKDIGDTYPIRDRDHAELLERQGIVEILPQEETDGLEGQNVDELKGIAAAETVDLGEASRKADIIAAIRAKRAQA